MEIRKEDVEILDFILNALAEDKSVDSDFLIQNNIVEKNLRYPNDSRKKAGLILESLNVCISHYCGKVNEKGAFGDNRYFFIKDNKTIPFKNSNGGFKELYKKQQDEKIKAENTERLRSEIDVLTKKNLKLQNEAARYEKRIRKWRFIALILGLITTSLGIYAFIFK